MRVFGKCNLIADALSQVSEIGITATVDFSTVDSTQNDGGVPQRLQSDFKYKLKDFPI